MLLPSQNLYRAIQGGGDIKEFLLERHRRNSGPLAGDISEMPTVSTLAVFPSATAKLVRLPRYRHVDQQGRLFIKLVDIEASTIDLADEAVDRFFELTGVFPDELVACPSRTARLNTYYYFSADCLPIPFVRDFMYPVDYDILARGHVS
jgi:hypothetical protein